MKHALIVCIALLLAVSLCGCSLTELFRAKDESGKYALNKERNEAVIDDAGTAAQVDVGNARVYYQIFVGSFSDSNGDGIGDLRGIINRFDYLNDGDPNSGMSLGVEGIWLTPIFASPSYHKYDVTDYYGIDPQFGTEEDLKELIALCKERDVQLILDLVINHTSVNHPWFKEFTAAHAAGEESSEYYDWYSWYEETQPGKATNAISGSTHLYECNFSTEMPELNFDNEAVRQKMVEIAKYYLDLGVDGFRFDAAKYIYYGKESLNIDFWNWYMAQLRDIKSDIYTVAEVWEGDNFVIPYFSSTNCFNFSIGQFDGKIPQAIRTGNVTAMTEYVERYIASIREQRADAMPVTFISNHDMDRAAGFLTVATGNAAMAANLSMLLPGSSFIYYGDEIGMKGSRGGSNTDANRRLAMLWGDDDTVADPIGADYSSEQINGTVAEHLPDGSSLYNHYKKLIMIRKANPEIAIGEFTPLIITDVQAGGFLSTHAGKTVAVLHNTTQEPVQIDLSKYTDVALTQLAASVGLGEATLNGTVLTLDGQTSAVLRG